LRWAEFFRAHVSANKVGNELDFRHISKPRVSAKSRGPMTTCVESFPLRDASCCVASLEKPLHDERSLLNQPLARRRVSDRIRQPPYCDCTPNHPRPYRERTVNCAGVPVRHRSDGLRTWLRQRIDPLIVARVDTP